MHAPGVIVLGSGVDLVETSRIEASIARFGDRFLERVFRAGEIAYCRRSRRPGPHFAARFAAKEAVSKAFGTGFGRDLGWTDVEVVRDEASGAPAIALHGGGLALALARGASGVLVSLSHDRSHAIATALVVAPLPAAAAPGAGAEGPRTR